MSGGIKETLKLIINTKLDVIKGDYNNEKILDNYLNLDIIDKLMRSEKTYIR